MITKRYVIDSNRFQKEQSILKISNNRDIDYNQLLGIVKNEIVPLAQWEKLNKYVDMKKYWVSDDERNTVVILEDLMMDYLDQKGKLMYKQEIELSNLWNLSKNVKTLGDYICFCKYLNVPYIKFLSPDDCYYPILKKMKNIKLKKKEDSEFKTYGSHKRIKLTDSEYKRLQDSVDDLEERIFAIDSWCVRKDIPSLLNPYYTIKNWGTQTMHE